MLLSSKSYRYEASIVVAYAISRLKSYK